MERRTFIQKALAFTVGFAAMARGLKAWAKGLPSDPDAPAGTPASPDVIPLPSFEKNGTFPLDQALLGRMSSRSYDANRKLTRQEISRLLWATTGVNRPDGKRTIPSARGVYPVDVVVALPEGAYRFDPKGHRLVRMIPDDIRSKIPAQDAFKSAAMTVIYVINKDKMPRIEFADLEVGCMGQNLYLEAVALGMGSLIYAGFRADDVAKALGLKENQVARIVQAVGPTK